MVLKQTLTVPPLEGGDRLSRDEFERRYEACHIKKAELIEGVVYVAAAVRSKSHGQPHAAIMTWLGNYWSTTPGVDLNDNTTVRLDADNEPQPDALLRITSWSSLFSVDVKTSRSGLSKACNSGLEDDCRWLRRWEYQDIACRRLARARFK